MNMFAVRETTGDADTISVSSELPVITAHDGILVPYQSLVRRPLHDWAAALQTRFLDAVELAKSNFLGAAGAITSCFNEAALVELHFGRADKARDLCSACMEWLHRHSQRPETLVIRQYAFEPYLNLGRLDRINHNPEEAMRKFQIIDNIAFGEGIDLGNLVVPAELCKDIFSRSTPLPRLLRTAFILEWIKLLLKRNQYQEAASFAPRCFNSVDITAMEIVWEGRIAALSRLRRYDEALAVASMPLTDRSGTNRSLFLFRRAETFAAAGRIEDSLRVARKLAAGYLNYPGALSVTRLGLLAHLTGLLADLRAEEAQPLAELGIRSAAAAHDILFQTEFLNLLGRFPGADQAALKSQIAEIRRKAWYGIAKHDDIRPDNTVSSLTEELLTFAAAQSSYGCITNYELLRWSE